MQPSWRHVLLAAIGAVPIAHWIQADDPAAAASPRASVTGRVVDARHRPIAGARVELTAPDASGRRLAISAADGSFAIGDVTARDLSIAAEADFAARCESIDCAAGDVLEIALAPAGVVRGSVARSSVAFSDVAAVLVAAEGPPRTAAVDGKGAFALTAVPAGRYRFELVDRDSGGVLFAASDLDVGSGRECRDARLQCIDARSDSVAGR